jgi:DNA-binding transcriptional ArsR family regulator
MVGLVVSQAGWLDAVANPIRLRIVRFLNRRESASLHELAEAVDAQRNTVRVHLRALMSAGVVVRLPGRPEGGRLGRPPARYRLERRLLPPGAARARAQARGPRPPVSVVVRDYPAAAPSWTLGEARWAAAVYLLESPWLAESAGRHVDYAARRVDWAAIERDWESYPQAQRLLAELARGLWAGEPRAPVSLVAYALAPAQRARALAAVAIAAGDATVVGVGSEDASTA